ncbi:hypothetical protein [uncultured Flavobacterium sp.]|uniref:hypothetical protein n=1 Tax=uncultured Flavobacterium sp. TaxID=165435 RepID=UPI0025F97A4A|nr:hypothetical protein [uncultured Flavobacterium sp.]
MLENQFAEIAGLIRSSCTNALKVVNTILIDLYWRIGQYIHARIESTEWANP